MKYLPYLLISVPIALLAAVLGRIPVIIFVSSCIALIPLARLLGEATEELAIHTGPKVGGLLNAPLGNAAELIITIVAPLLVFISLLFGPEMTLFFSLFEVAALALSALIAAQVSVDGESNWLEGAQLRRSISSLRSGSSAP